MREHGVGERNQTGNTVAFSQFSFQHWYSKKLVITTLSYKQKKSKAKSHQKPEQQQPALKIADTLNIH